MKKKILLVLTTILLACVVMFTLTACGEKEPPHKHVYDKQVASQVFKASEATCEAKAKYYYSCSCGDKGTETFQSGATLGHAYGEYVSIGNGQHKKVCANDNSHEIIRDCYGGQANCAEFAKCSVCEAEYGELTEHNHNVLKSNQTQHWYECVCGDKDGIENHKGGTATCTKLAVCSVCSENYGSLGTHSYIILKSNQTEHWDECVCGEKTNFEAHIPGATPTETTDQKCTKCNYIINSALGHIHTLHLTKVDAKPQSCVKEGNSEYYSCSCGKWFTDNTATTEIIDKESVIIAKDEHEHSLLNSDGAQHWYECVCGDKKDIEQHYGGEATCVKRAICESCSQSYGALGEHKINSQWQKIESMHFQTCLEQGCYAQFNVGEHNFNSDKQCVDCGWITTKLLGTELVAEGFVLNGDSLYLEVSNNVTLFNFSGVLNVANQATYKIFKNNSEVSGQLEISVGENAFVVTVYSQGYDSQDYSFVIYRKNIFTIEFDTDGGTQIETQYIEEGGLVNVPQDPIKRGCSFVGWDYDFTQKVKENITIKAQYQIGTYSLTIKRNNGQDDIVLTKLFGEEIVELNNLENIERPGYIFLGWTDEFPTTMPDKNTIINAVWDLLYEFEGGTVYSVRGKYINALDTLVIPSEIEGEKITAVGIYDFKGKEIIIPSTVTELCWFNGTSAQIVFDGKCNVTHIAEGAFADYCGSKIVIPESVETIGAGAFRDCAAEIEFKTTKIEDLGNEVFSNYKGKSLIIPDNVKSISSSTFYQCVNLEKLYIPSTVESIGIQALGDCQKLIELTLPFTGVKDSIQEAYKIGQLFNTYNVSNDAHSDINDYVPTTLKRLTINGNTIVLAQAFEEIKGLETLILGDLVQGFISNKNYDESHELDVLSCPKLTEIYFGKNIKDISKYILRQIKVLTKITVDAQNPTFDSFNGVMFTKGFEELVCCPKSLNGNVYLNKNVKTIDISTITYAKITGFVVDAENAIFKAENGVLYSKDGKNLIKYPEAKKDEKFIVPSSVTSITNPIKNTQIKVLVVSDNVTKFVSDLSGHIDNNENLKVVLLGKGISEVVTFNRNPYLAIVGKNNSLEVEVSKDTAVYNIEATDVEIKDGFAFATHAPTQTNWIFAYLGDDVNIVLPDDYYGNPYKIANNAFSNCDNIKSITLGAKAIRVDGVSFYGCDNLSEILVKENNQDFKSIDGVLYSKDGKTLIKYPQAKSGALFNIPEGVVTIQQNAFLDVSVITDLTLPSTLENIRDEYIADLSLNYIEENGFKYIKHGDNEYGAVIGSTRDDIVNLEIREGCLIVFPYAFYEYSGIKTLTLPDSVVNIGAGAFYKCSGLTNVKLSQDLKEIGNHAFYGCSSLTTISIPDSVENIRDSAISSCSNLLNVYFGENSKIREIGNFAFAYNPNLRTVVLERKNPIDIIFGEYCFYSDTVFVNSSPEIKWGTAQSFVRNGDFVYYYDGTDYVLFEYVGNSSEVIVPDYITKLSAGAFKNNTIVRKVVVPNSVKNMGAEVFYGCSNLEQVVLPESITNISKYAFAYCHKLKEVNLPENITSISEAAFYCCYSLTEICIPNKVTSIGSMAFASCINLNKVIIGENVSYIATFVMFAPIIDAFTSCNKLVEIVNYSQLDLQIGSEENGCIAYNALFITNVDQSIIKREGDFVFATKNGVNYLINYLGEQTNLVLPTDYHGERYVIYSSALANKNLESVEFTSVVIEVMSDAFSKNPDLTKVNFVGDLSTWCERGYAKAFSYDYGLYINDQLITEVLLTKELSTLEYAFNNCNSITKVAIKSDVAEIAKTIFNNVNSINEIDYFGTAGSWAEKSFVTGFNNEYNLYINGVILTEVLLDGTSVGSSAFSNCISITKIVVGDSVQTIEYNAFNDIKNLEYLELTFLGDKKNNAKYNYFGIIFGATQNNQQNNSIPLLKTLKLTGVQSLPYRAFYGIKNIETIILPNTLTSIGEHAFNGCSANIVWEENATITEFGPSSFCGYIGKELIIPDSVTSFGSYATGSMTAKIIWGKTPIEALSQTYADYLGDTITFPVGIKHIYQGTFYNCKVETIIIPKTVVFIESYAFRECTAKIYFEEGSLYTSVATQTFNQYLGDTIILPDSVLEIEEEAFSDCVNLINVHLGNSVTELKDDVFLRCKSLRKIIIPDSVETLNNRVFWDCEGLEEIVIGKNVKDLGSGAFAGLTAKITWPEDFAISTLGSRTFSAYQGEEIVIPACIESIESEAFYDCTAKIVWEEGININVIESYALSSYKGEEIVIPSSVTQVEYAAFQDSSAKIIWPEDCKITIFDSNVFYGYMGESVTVPSSIIEITSNIFVEHNAKVIMESENFNIVDGGVLSSDGKILLAVIEQVNTTYTIPASVQTIKEYAFMGVTAKVVWDANTCMDEIDKYAFSGYAGTCIELPNTIKVIGEGAFSDCENLTQITLPSELKDIESSAFYNCINLKEIVVPDGVETLKQSTFNDCQSLVSITFGKNLKTIENWAIVSAKGAVIKYNGTMAEWKSRFSIYENRLSQTFAIISCNDGDFLL